MQTDDSGTHTAAIKDNSSWHVRLQLPAPYLEVGGLAVRVLSAVVGLQPKQNSMCERMTACRRGSIEHSSMA